MYKSHRALTEPHDDAILWRYMDFERFVAMLEWRALFFPRLTALDDPFEGHPPRKVVEMLAEGDKVTARSAELLKPSLSAVALFKGARTTVCASCWHINPEESVAMWGLYSRLGAGISVQSTFGRFKAALAPAVEDVHGGIVNYVDYETYTPETLNILQWALCKRRSFAHESEFRGLVVRFDPNDPGNPGAAITVNLEQLIERVYVSPTSPEWVERLARSLLQRYGLSVDIKRSSILDGPSYYP